MIKADSSLAHPIKGKQQVWIIARKEDEPKVWQLLT